MNRAGYWPSAWPVECGGNHRPKTVDGPGLDLGPTDHLVATTRHTGGWPVMFVRRDPGELYLCGTSEGDDPEVAGWVERVDPVTLEPFASSGPLPAGDHEWCGSMAVHRNGDLYMVNGSYVHRLGPDCRVVAEVALPVDHAHNGLLVLDDGSLVTKDIRLGATASTLTVLDPDLSVLASVPLPEASMGRIAALADEGGGSHIIVPGATRLHRYRWDGRNLELDPGWQPTYRGADQGGLAWDTTLVDGRAWLMDNGNLPGIEERFSTVPTTRLRPGAPRAGPAWTDPVRVVGISLTDPYDVITLSPTELPGGWVIAPPLVHDGIVVAWDTGNTGLAGFELSPTGMTSMLWFQPFRCSMQPMLFPETGELVVNDFRLLPEEQTSDDLVVLDVRTGTMKSRIPTGATRMNGMFLCPGWDRDVYYCTSGAVARIRAESLA